MNNEWLNVILDNNKKIDEEVMQISGELTESDKKLFATKLSEYISSIYHSLRFSSNSNDSMFSDLKVLVDSLYNSCSAYVDEFADSLKNNVHIATEQLKNGINSLIATNVNENSVSLYNTRLENYNDSLEKLKENIRLYRSGKLTYENCKGEFDILNVEYKELMNQFSDLNRSDIQKPKRPSSVPKNIGDLRILNLSEKVESYQSLSNYFETDVVSKYMDARKKYESGEITSVEFMEITVDCSEKYLNVKGTYSELATEFDNLQQSFSSDDSYMLGSEQELDIFFKEKKEYEELIERYHKVMSQLDSLVSSGRLSSTVFDSQNERYIEMLDTKRKSLNRLRKKIYNASMLNQLRERKKLFEKYLKISSLSEDQRREITEKYELLVSQIKEIEKFRDSIKVRNYLKPINSPLSELSNSKTDTLDTLNNEQGEIIPTVSDDIDSVDPDSITTPDKKDDFIVPPSPSYIDVEYDDSIPKLPEGDVPLGLPDHIKKMDDDSIPRLPEGDIPLGLPDNVKQNHNETPSFKKSLDFDDLIHYIADGNDITNVERYSGLDKFIYSASTASLVSWHHGNERTFLDKPIRLVRTGVGAVVKASAKLLANLLRLDKKRAQKIDDIITRVNGLTDEQLDLIENYSNPTDLKQRFNTLPDVVYTTILSRIQSRRSEMCEKINNELYNRYIKLIDDFKQCSEEMRLSSNPEDVRKKYSDSLRNQVDGIEKYRLESEKLINKSGFAAMSDNFTSRMANLVGGRNSSRKDHMVERMLAGNIGNLKNKARDGYEFASMYLYKQKVFADNSEQKRTLKNRLGRASVGAFEFSPFVELADYTPYEYAKDVLLTFTTVMSIMSLANQIQQMQAFEQLKTEHSKLVGDYNQLVGNYKNLAGEYQNLQSWVANYQSKVNDLIVDLNNGGTKAASAMEDMLRTLPGQMHGSVEYAMMQADASSVTSYLQSSGKWYGSIDDSLHKWSSNITSSNENLIKSMQGQPLDVQLKSYQSQMQKIVDDYKNFLKPLKSSNETYINTWASFDETAITSLFNNINTVNPSALNSVVNDIKNSVSTILSIKNLPPAAIKAVNTISASGVADKSSLIPAIATLAGLGVLDMANIDTKKLISDSESLKNDLVDRLDDVSIELQERARLEYDAACEQWDKEGYYYLLGQKITRKYDPLRDDIRYMFNGNAHAPNWNEFQSMYASIEAGRSR